MWVKVCGLTDVDNAMHVAEAGVNAIGLNFFRGSKRYVEPDLAREIADSLPPSIEPVGLFVNHSEEEIRELAKHVGLHTLQLHGDETPELAGKLEGFRIIRAFRVDENSVPEFLAELESFHKAGVELFAALVDARVSHAYGGTGETAPWDLITRHYDFAKSPPLILAGGLTPENIAEAVSTVNPWGVDTASGVETSPGIKGRELVREFVASARSAGSPPVAGEP